jgi:predicted transcriptional regulator with HTH domain
MLGKSSKAKFEHVFRSLRRSRVRTEILMYLYNHYPRASYPAEIARDTGINPTNVLGGLKGMNRFDASHSLLKQGFVEEMEQGDIPLYRLSERGKSLMERMHDV